MSGHVRDERIRGKKGGVSWYQIDDGITITSEPEYVSQDGRNARSFHR